MRLRRRRAASTAADHIEAVVRLPPDAGPCGRAAVRPTERGRARRCGSSRCAGTARASTCGCRCPCPGSPSGTTTAPPSTGASTSRRGRGSRSSWRRRRRCRGGSGRSGAGRRPPATPAGLRPSRTGRAAWGCRPTAAQRDRVLAAAVGDLVHRLLQGPRHRRPARPAERRAGRPVGDHVEVPEPPGRSVVHEQCQAATPFRRRPRRGRRRPGSARGSPGSRRRRAASVVRVPGRLPPSVSSSCRPSTTARAARSRPARSRRRPRWSGGASRRSRRRRDRRRHGPASGSGPRGGLLGAGRRPGWTDAGRRRSPTGHARVRLQRGVNLHGGVTWPRPAGRRPAPRACSISLFTARPPRHLFIDTGPPRTFPCHLAGIESPPRTTWEPDFRSCLWYRPTGLSGTLGTVQFDDGRQHLVGHLDPLGGGLGRGPAAPTRRPRRRSAGRPIARCGRGQHVDADHVVGEGDRADHSLPRRPNGGWRRTACRAARRPSLV